MNTADYVDQVIAQYKVQIASGGIPLSEAAWKTALACVGWPYVYSAWGAYCTPSERRKRFKLCPDKTSIKAKCQVIRDKDPKPNCVGCQWYPDELRVRCFDCRGFTHWILLQYGFDLEGDIVSTQWNSKKNWCVKGEIGVDPIPQNVLVNVFIKNKSTGKWTHTGLYFNGSTCECSNGVQYFEKMKSNRWTHWAVAACFKSGWTMPQKEPEKQPVADKGEQPVSDKKTIRKGSKGDLVKECQTMLQKLGYSLGSYGVDGDFGNATEKAVKAFQKDHKLTQDGVVGQKTWAALQQAVDALNATPAIKYYTLTVSHLTEGEKEKLMSEFGDKVTKIVEE